MGIRYDGLDAVVRHLMVQELQRDLEMNNLYIRSRLTDAGKAAWPQILREAFEQYDDAWIATEIRSRGYMHVEEVRSKPSGGVTAAKVPYTAPDTLAEGEFNRFYIRAVCAYVLATGGSEVEVYRGKEVENPRQESQALVGQLLPAADLLADLRISIGVEPALGLPRGPNSGLTIRRPQGQPRTA